MAWQLVAEVMDDAPTDLTPAEYVVLLVIAEQANQRTRVAHQGRKPWDLATRSRLSPTGLRSVLQRLAARGLEVRVQLTTAAHPGGVFDAHGRPVYACRGRSTDYRLPRFASTEGDVSSSPLDPPKATSARRHSGSKGDATASLGDVSSSPLRPNGDVSSSPPTSRSSVSSTSYARERASPAAQIIAERTDATTAEAAAVVATLQRERPDIRSLAAALGSFTDEELTGRVDAVRGEAHRRGVRDFLDWAATQPECVDFVAGGDLLRPDTNLPVCVACRRRKEADR